MSTQEKETVEVCPHCGQPLLSEGAAVRLRATRLEAEQRLEAAVRALTAELTGELLARPRLGPAGEPELVHAPETEQAQKVHDFRLAGRQF